MNLKRKFYIKFSAKEIISFFNNTLKNSHFKILFENGEYVNKTKIDKIESIITKYSETINIILITNEEVQTFKEFEKEELNKFNKFIENRKISKNAKNIIESIISFKSEINKLENQKIILKSINNFHKSYTDKKIIDPLDSLNKSHLMFSNKLSLLEKTFKINYNQLEESIKSEKQDEDILSDLKFVEKSYSELKKLFLNFDEKLKTIDKFVKSFCDKSKQKQEENKLITTDSLIEVIKRVELGYELLYSLYRNQEDITILNKIESLNFLTEHRDRLHYTRRDNSNKISSMLEDSGKNKKLIIEKIKDINFSRTKIEDNLEIASLPEIFTNEKVEIQKEITKRGEFDYIFQKYTKFLETNLIAREESRMKSFSERMSKYCKSDVYKNIFSKIFKKLIVINDSISPKINELANSLEEQLGKVCDYLYEVKLPVESNNTFDTQKIEAAKLENHKKLFDSQFEIISKLRLDLEALLKENNSVKNSFDYDKSITNLKEIKDLESYFIFANKNLLETEAMIKMLYEVPKNSNNNNNNYLANLDISNNSLINSIYFSNILNENQSSNNSPNQNNIDKNSAIFNIEKFVMKYEDRIYFYDALFDYMNSFIELKKIKFSLVREKPEELGVLIETILKDWLKTKKALESYKTKIKNLCK